jgi:hypothetical protein
VGTGKIANVPTPSRVVLMVRFGKLIVEFQRSRFEYDTWERIVFMGSNVSGYSGPTNLVVKCLDTVVVNTFAKI